MAPVDVLEREIEILEEPMVLAEIVVEEMTIDCICGVY